MPSKFSKKKMRKKTSNRNLESIVDIDSINFFNKMLESEFGLGPIFNPEERITNWDKMVSTIPDKFPTIPKINLMSATKKKITTIKTKIKECEDLWQDGEFVVDKIDQLNEQLLSNYSIWLRDPTLIDRSGELFDPEFVAQIFVDFALNYEGELEEGLECIDTFLISHFIRKTMADDKTYLWAPFSLYFFLHFLHQTNIINESSLMDGVDLIADTRDKFYSIFRRYIDPKDNGVFDEMMLY